MKPRHVLPLAFAILLGPSAVAQLDVYWQASRTSKELHRINACGEFDLRVDLSTNFFPGTTAPQLRAAFLAPDGKVWVVNFIVNHFTLLNGDGTNIRNIPVKSGGYPYAIVFDKTGQAYMTMTGRGTGLDGVEVRDKDGKLVKTYDMKGGNPLGITIDANGNAWVAHRLNPPSKITMIDPVKGTMTDFKFPASAKTLGGQIVADYQGIAKKSTIWCIGDRSSELLNFDSAGKFLGMYTIDPNSTTISAMTIDAQNNIWIGNFRTPDIFYFDTKLKKVTRNIQNPPNVLGLAIDSRGRLLATARVSFSGPQPSVVRRFNTTTFVMEQSTQVGIGAGSRADSGFHRALVVDPFGDFDKDGVANFVEVTNLTAPYDAQSNAETNVLVVGANSRGGQISVKVLGRSTSTAVLGIGLKKLATPSCIPVWRGCLLLDPATIFAAFSYKVPGSLDVTLPNDAALVGALVRF
ncbi:MAG: Vgb family protein, partial [Planctomycetota bacterium]